MFVCCFQTAIRRTHDEAFSDDDDDDWVFDPTLDRVMVGGGAAAATPLLEFDLQPIGARRKRVEPTTVRGYLATTSGHYSHG